MTNKSDIEERAEKIDLVPEKTIEPKTNDPTKSNKNKYFQQDTEFLRNLLHSPGKVKSIKT